MKEFFYLLFNHRAIIRRMEAELMKPLETRVLEFKANLKEVYASFESPISKEFVAMTIDLFREVPGADNYLQFDVRHDGEPYLFTIQRKLGVSPSERAHISKLAEMQASTALAKLWDHVKSGGTFTDLDLDTAKKINEIIEKS